MFAKLWLFFSDAATFDAATSGLWVRLSSNARLRGLLLALVLGIAGGQIPLGPLGPYLYWAVPIIGYLTGSIAHGDKTSPELKALETQIQTKPAGAALVAEAPPIVPVKP